MIPISMPSGCDPIGGRRSFEPIMRQVKSLNLRMAAPPSRARLPQSVLFACGLNSVRFPDGRKPAAADVYRRRSMSARLA